MNIQPKKLRPPIIQETLPANFPIPQEVPIADREEFIKNTLDDVTEWFNE